MQCPDVAMCLRLSILVRRRSEFRRGAAHAVPDSVRVARLIRADTAAAAVSA